MVLKGCFTFSESDCVYRINTTNLIPEAQSRTTRQKLQNFMLMLMSGNVQPNPGPKGMTGFKTPADFKSRTGLGFIHLNVRSFSKMVFGHIQVMQMQLLYLTYDCLNLFWTRTFPLMVIMFIGLIGLKGVSLFM